MYEAFFELNELPFGLTPNPRYFCPTRQHREALSNLEYGITSARGITLLLGEAGTGKTTLICTALETCLGDDPLCVWLTNPTLSRLEFVRYLADGFRLGGEAAGCKAVFLRELEQLLRARRKRGALTLLVIDEAQSLPYELLEEVRLLANMETAEEKLLPVILAGQPEFSHRLNESSLRQLKQRIALRCTVEPLDVQQTAAYIAGRLRVAGGDGLRVFTREAVERIYAHSGGIPRTISVICDNALVAGFAMGERPVTSRLVAEVCADFDLNARATKSKHAPSGLTSVSTTTDLTPPLPAEGAVASSAPAPEIFEAVRRERRFSFF